MEIEEIKKIVKEHYDLNIDEVQKIKNVYKIRANSMNYCLKVIKYDFGHFLFIINAIKHLQKNGFENIPVIISDKHGKEYRNALSLVLYVSSECKAKCSRNQ